MGETFPSIFFQGANAKCLLSHHESVFLFDLDAKCVSEGGREGEKERRVCEDWSALWCLCVCVSLQLLRFRAGVDAAEDKVVFFSELSFSACSVTVSMAHMFFRALLPRLSALCLQVSNLLQLHQTHSVPTSCNEGGVDAALLWCDLERCPNLRYDLSLTDFHHLLFCAFWLNHPLARRARCASLCGQFKMERRGSRGCGVEWSGVRGAPINDAQ